MRLSSHKLCSSTLSAQICQKNTGQRTRRSSIPHRRIALAFKMPSSFDLQAKRVDVWCGLGRSHTLSWHSTSLLYSQLQGPDLLDSVTPFWTNRKLPCTEAGTYSVSRHSAAYLCYFQNSQPNLHRDMQDQAMGFC